MAMLALTAMIVWSMRQQLEHGQNQPGIEQKLTVQVTVGGLAKLLLGPNLDCHDQDTPMAVLDNPNIVHQALNQLTA